MLKVKRLKQSQKSLMKQATRRMDITPVKIEIYVSKSGNTELKTLQNINFEYTGKKFVIQPGYISDGCSIPRMFWSLITPQINGKTLLQSIIHDFLFEHKLGFWASNLWYARALYGCIPLVKVILIFVRTNNRRLVELFFQKTLIFYFQLTH